MELMKSKVLNYGLCCNSCQENVDIHACVSCGKGFNEDDVIYCKHHSHTDCQHYHESCKPLE